MYRLLISGLLLLLLSPEVLAQEDRARSVFEEVENRRNKITWEQTDMEMVIVDPRGRTRTRTLTSYSFADGDTEKSLLVFESPANVQGTGFLTLSEGNDEVQKLYLPALGRVQTITASQKADRFMGSDFTYEDLGDQNPDDYSFELLEEGDQQVILRAVKQEDSQYAWVKFYINLNHYTLVQAEYFNDRDVMVKRLVAEDFTNVDQDVWRANRMTMYDLQEERRTELVWTNRTINEEIPAWRFTERVFRRGN